MTDIMKLAEEHAVACSRLGDHYVHTRAALQSAIEALQKEVSTLDVLLEECKMDWSGDVTQLKAEHKHEIEALQSKLGDAIQSSAHWQHQFTEAQAEIDLLKGYRDRALELATAYNNAQENIEQISAHRQHILAVNEKLTAQVDTMSKGEPVAHVYAIERTGRPLVAWDDAKGIGLGDKLYAAPKALTP